MDILRKNKQIQNLAAVFGSTALAFLAYLFYKKIYSPCMTKMLEAKTTFLTKVEAMRRSSLITDVSYVLLLNLKNNIHKEDFNRRFDGQIRIKFNLTKVEEVFLDFTGHVEKLFINGKLIANFKHNQNRIYLDIANLKLQNNEVIIHFENKYSHDSHGLRYWSDINNASDNNESYYYIYSNLEPCYANTVFPCFDQPDLKARFKLFTTNEEDIEVISSSSTSLINKDLIIKSKNLEQKNSIFANIGKTFNFNTSHIRTDFVINEFEETDPIPTYAFLLCAGKYTVFDEVVLEEDELKGNCPPIRIFLRNSLFGRMEEKDIFFKARRYIDWYCELFAMKIPFKKLDIIFVPELGSLSSEHIGAITLDDKLVQPKMNPIEYDLFHLRLAQSIAHIWFGNYVTQKWWDDLWMKESICTYLAANCLYGLAEKFKSSNDKEVEFVRLGQIWQHFTELKSMAFLKEQFENNHALITDCEDVHYAESLYDDFLSQKGSSVMSYFEYIVGKETIFSGLKKIVSDYGLKNIDYSGFKNTFELILKPSNINDKSPFTLVEPLLINEGMNKLELEVVYGADLKFLSVTVIQKNSSHETVEESFYPFLFDVLLIYENTTRNTIISKIQIEAKRTNDLTQYFIGREKPEAIILNYNDKSYFTQVFEEKTALWLYEHVHKIDDTVTILVIARDMFDSVRRAEIDPANFIRFSHDLLLKKHNLDHNLIKQILTYAIYIVNHCFLFKYRVVFKNQLFNLIMNLTKYYYALRNFFFESFLEIFDCTSDEHTNFLLNFIKDKDMIKRSDRVVSLSSNNLSGHSFLKQVSMEQDYDFEYLNHETSKKILETIFSLPVTKCSEEKRERVKNYFFNHDATLANELYFEDTLSACGPFLDIKTKCWDLISLKNDKSFLDQKYYAIMRGFARKEQYELLKDFYKDRFFKVFFDVKRNHGVLYAENFFKYLNPSFIISHNMLNKLIWLRDKRISEKDFVLKKSVSKAISELEMNLEVAEKYMNEHETIYQKSNKDI